MALILGRLRETHRIVFSNRILEICLDYLWSTLEPIILLPILQSLIVLRQVALYSLVVRHSLVLIKVRGERRLFLERGRLLVPSLSKGTLSLLGILLLGWWVHVHFLRRIFCKDFLHVWLDLVI